MISIDHLNKLLVEELSTTFMTNSGKSFRFELDSLINPKRLFINRAKTRLNIDLDNLYQLFIAISSEQKLDIKLYRNQYKHVPYLYPILINILFHNSRHINFEIPKYEYQTYNADSSFISHSLPSFKYSDHFFDSKPSLKAKKKPTSLRFTRVYV